MKSKVSIFITVSIVLSLLLIGSVVAQEVVAEEATFLEKLLNFFKTIEFTIVGQDVGAAPYPSKTWDNIQPGTTFIDNANNYCSSGHGLFDVFVDNYIPRFEMKDKVEFFCSSNNQKCVVELYCMPRDFCSYDSDCPSNNECVFKTATDPYMPLKDTFGNSVSTYSYCTPIQGCTGSDINCWSVNNNICEKRTYDCNYATYPNCPTSYPHTSLSSCEGDLPGECTSGQTKCEGTTYYTCSNENWANQGQVVGKCGYPTPTNGNGDLNIAVSNIILPTTSTAAAVGTDPAIKEYSFKVTLKNNGGETSTINVEAGFYTYNYAKEVAKLFSIISPAVSCVNEPFVKTMSVTLLPGESETVEIKVAPLNAYVTLPVSTYILKDIKLTSFLGVYETCCQKLPDFEGCVEGTGGYIGSEYNPGFNIPEQYATGSDEITCDAKIYGKLDWNFFESDKIMILDDYRKCISYTFYTEKGEINETATSANTYTLKNIKKISLTKNKISKSTSQELLASACLDSSECGYYKGNQSGGFDINCISITKLREEGILSEAAEDNFFDNAGTIVRGTSYGAAGGVLACGIGWATAGFLVGGPAGATVSVISLLANPATLGGCGAVGALLGGVGTAVYLDVAQDDELLEALEAKNADAVGICTVESKSAFLNYFGWAAWFDLTGDGIKDGTDGLIITLIGGFVIFLLLRK